MGSCESRVVGSNMAAGLWMKESGRPEGRGLLSARGILLVEGEGVGNGAGEAAELERSRVDTARCDS